MRTEKVFAVTSFNSLTQDYKSFWFDLPTVFHSAALFVFQADGAVQARDIAPGVARLGRAAQTHQAGLPGHEERRPQPHHEVHIPRVQKGHQQVRLFLRGAASQTGSEYIHHHRWFPV